MECYALFNEKILSRDILHSCLWDSLLRLCEENTSPLLGLKNIYDKIPNWTRRDS